MNKPREWSNEIGGTIVRPLECATCKIHAEEIQQLDNQVQVQSRRIGWLLLIVVLLALCVVVLMGVVAQ